MGKEGRKGKARGSKGREGEGLIKETKKRFVD
jgi:hypothetical protein